MSQVLEDLLTEVQRPVAAGASGTKVNAIAKTRYTHDAMVDLIIAQPAISQNDLAAHFGYSASWISQVIASDAFQTKLAERTKDVVDPVVRASVEQQFKGIVLRSMEILKDKLSLPSAAIPDQLALRALELSSKALGYGVKQPEAQRPAVEMHVHLEQLGENLTKLLDRKKREALPIDTTFSELAPDQPPAS